MGKLKESGITEGGKVSPVNPKVRILKIFLNINEIINEDVVGIIKNHIKGVRGIGIYGSWADGTNVEGSDLDIWVVVGKRAPDPVDSANAAAEIEKKTDTERKAMHV